MTASNPYLNSIKASPGIRLSILFGLFFICLVLTSGCASIINALPGSERTHSLIAAVVQCLMAFCFPAFVLAKFCSSKPLSWLKLTPKVSIKPFIGVLIVYVISLPAMEWIIDWNQNISFPSFLSGIESTFRGWEEANEAASKILLNVNGFFPVLAGVLIIGILTGFSEEIFFRSGVQGILTRSNLGKNSGVWMAAIIFSAMHFQFFGFIPRLLMGAFFGYLLLWTGDVKISMFAHMLNNSIVVITAGLNGEESLLPKEGEYMSSPLLLFASLSMTVLFFLFFRGYFFKDSHKHFIPWQKSQYPPISER